MPRIIPWRLGLISIGFSLLLLLQGGCTDNRSSAPAESVFRNTFEPCQLPAPLFGGSISAQCGYRTVPENRSTNDIPSDDGSVIDLHVALLPAISRTPIDDPLFFIPGGPGQAATESYGQVASAFLNINQDRDIILVDQRGTGKSNPLRCAIPSELEEGSEPTDEEVHDWLKKCAEELDADTTMYTTTAAVDDLEEIRLSLGYAKINLYGVSYGTRVALAYADRYPEHVRSMILDGVVPSDQAVGSNVARNAQATLDKIVDLCGNEPGCSAAFPALGKSVKSLISVLDADPIEVTLPHPVDGLPTDITVDRQSVASVIRLHSYAPETTALLPLLIHSAQVEENLEPLAAQSILVSQQLEDSISIGLNLSVVCAEDAPYLDQAAVDEANAGTYYQDFETERMLRFCQAWPSAEPVPNLKKAVESDVPTLLLSGEFDPVTPPSNAEQAAATLSNSLHVVAPYQGHAVVTRGCIPRLIDDFLVQADPAEVMPACVNNMKPVPFFISFAGPNP